MLSDALVPSISRENQFAKRTLSTETLASCSPTCSPSQKRRKTHKTYKNSQLPAPYPLPSASNDMQGKLLGKSKSFKKREERSLSNAQKYDLVSGRLSLGKSCSMAK